MKKPNLITGASSAIAKVAAKRFFSEDVQVAAPLWFVRSNCKL